MNGGHPVNPHAATVLGLPAYPDIRAVPESVDLALVVVPAGAVAVCTWGA